MNARRSLAAALLCLAAVTAAAEEARIPYRLLYKIQSTKDEVNRAHTNLVVAAVIQSTSPYVEWRDLKLRVESKGGPVPVEVRAGGEFVVPLRDDLLAENPWVVVNQRKGTIRLEWRAAVVTGKLGRAVRYAKLMAPLRDCADVQRQMQPCFPNAPEKTITGLKLDFPSSTNRPVVIIHSRDGDRRLEAEPHGEIMLPYAPELLAEDPEVALSEIPAIVEIVSRPAN